MTMPGPMELGLILLIVAVVFGAKRLPQLGEGLGKGIRNFKKSMSGLDDDTAKTETPKIDDKV